MASQDFSDVFLLIFKFSFPHHQLFLNICESISVLLYLFIDLAF